MVFPNDLYEITKFFGKDLSIDMRAVLQCGQARCDTEMAVEKLPLKECFPAHVWIQALPQLIRFATSEKQVCACALAHKKPLESSAPWRSTGHELAEMASANFHQIAIAQASDSVWLSPSDDSLALAGNLHPAGQEISNDKIPIGN